MTEYLACSKCHKLCVGLHLANFGKPTTASLHDSQILVWCALLALLILDSLLRCRWGVRELRRNTCKGGVDVPEQPSQSKAETRSKTNRLILTMAELSPLGSTSCFKGLKYLSLLPTYLYYLPTYLC